MMNKRNLNIQHVKTNRYITPAWTTGFRRCVCGLFLCLCWGIQSLYADSSLPQPAPADSTNIQKPKPKPRKLKNDISFDPLSYQLQDRYVVQGDSFRNRFLDHFYLGFVTGVAKMAPKGNRPMNSGIPFGGIIGYDFNKLHGVRATVSHTNYDMEDGDGTVKQWEVDLDYIFNLSNYLKGYDKRRLFHVSPTLGVGYVASTYRDCKASIFKGQAGLNIGIGLGRNARFFVEPFFSVLSDQADHSGTTNVSKYGVQYGLKTGLAINLDNTNDFYTSQVVYTRGFFYEIGQGITFYHSDDLDFFKTAGTGYQISVGRWFDPIVGLRLSGTGSEYMWSYEKTAASLTSPSYEKRYKGSMFAARLEGLINPLNFMPYWRQIRHRFEMNLAIGGEYGWLIKRMPENENDLQCNYAGFTGAVSFLYNMDKETSFFVEPRVVVANFRRPYTNLPDREASFTETTASISAGLRICAINRRERTLWPKYTFVTRMFTGLQIGGLKRMQSVKDVGDFGLNYSGQFYLGFHLGPYVTLKGAIEYETLNDNSYEPYTVDFMGMPKQFMAMWHFRYNLLNLKAIYMLNLSNVYQKYDLNRKFNLYIEGGLIYTKCMSTDVSLFSDELQVGQNPRPMNQQLKNDGFGLLVGAVGQYRINDRWSLIIEPEVDFYLKDKFLGGNSTPYFNTIVSKVNIGTSYTF